jgi:type IV pilus assembly protein PilB
MNTGSSLLALASPRLATISNGEAAADCYAISGDDIRAAFFRYHLYPLSLASASVYESALQLYVQWLDLTGTKFSAAERPWLPVGRVGPMMVLGHCEPAAIAPLPPRWFQPVLLRNQEYEAHLKLCGPLIQALAAPDWDSPDIAAPRRLFPGKEAVLIKPTTMRAALRFLIEYYPHPRAELQRIQEILVASDDIDVDALPAGYLGACWVLLELGGIADPTVVAIPEQVSRRVPPQLAPRIRVISEHAKNVWIGLERLPQPDVEDGLLNELGEGWSVHCLLIDASRQLNQVARSEPYLPPRNQEDSGSKIGGRPRVKIEDARTRSRTSASVREPGVIRLTQKDVRELESYNARRPDRDPLKVFLKELSAGIRHGATDLHIELGLESYRVRARIDGYLEEWLEMPSDFGKMVVGAAKEQFGMPPERWMPQDGACTVYHGSDIVNLRVAAYPVRGTGQKLAIRYLPRRGEVPRLHELMPMREAALMRRAISRPYGLILLCGPTGSGKTTTTFSALAEINSPEINITTMEDPVEYEMDGINQAELDKARSVDWGTLLSGFLRQDPDVGMVGEIRDRETAETAIRLTLTGHIVFATLHTMSCAHTVERLVDTGVNAQMFANAATLIVSQRLVRRLCSRCKDSTRRPPTDAEQKLFCRHDIEVPPMLYDAARTACEDCRSTGYKGQVAAFEMLPVTDEVAQLIAEKTSVHAIDDWMRRGRFPRVYQSALVLVARGETSMAEANQWQSVWEDMPIAGSVPQRG